MRRFATVTLFLEPVLLIIVIAALWFPEPYRVNALVLLIPPALARLILYRRLWVNTPVNNLLYLFVLLCILNTYVALADPVAPPFSWGWYMLGRPIMGIAVALSMISIVYERKSIDGTLLLLLLLTILVGFLGLLGAQYAGKSLQLASITSLLPQLRSFPGAEGGFNVNEIGGAMAYCAPLAAGLAIYYWRERKALIWRVLATVAFLLLTLALFLGQSRLSLIGLIIALGGLIFLLIPVGRWRYIALAALLVFTGIEVSLVGQVFRTSSAASSYVQSAESSTEMRIEIGAGALTLIREYPLTGYGLNQFRRRDVRNELIPDYPMTSVPHAHNELLQIGADTGVPGIILFVAWHLALCLMIWRTWRKGDGFLRAVSISAAAGLGAHAVFGMGDAITLFDRFAFVYWLLVGLVGSAYVLTFKHPKTA